MMQRLNNLFNKKKSSVSSSLPEQPIQQPSQQGQEMDPQIWKMLPRELLDRVLALLPLSTFLNLRSTCKHFQSLVFSPLFISTHSSLANRSRAPSFLVHSHPHFYNTIQLYDPESGTWKACPLPIADPSSSLRLLSSSNGLFCFLVPNSFNFLVCNLLTKSSRVIRLPNRYFESFSFVSSPSGYKILLTASNRTFLYDTISHNWTSHQPTTSNLPREGVFFKGAFFFCTLEPVSVVSFNVEERKWKEHESEVPSHLAFARLVTDGEERLLLVGGIGENGISRSVKVWELSSEGRRWDELETLPALMSQKLLSVCYHNYSHLHCLWHQGMICLYCYSWPEILYWHVSRRTWHWIPKCPALPVKWSCGFSWFSFAPKLVPLA